MILLICVSHRIAHELFHAFSQGPELLGSFQGFLIEEKAAGKALPRPPCFRMG